MVAELGDVTPIVVVAGQGLKSAAFHLTPTGTVGGRIIDEAGQPAIGVPVFVLRSVYDSTGLKNVRQVVTGTADDRGEFRLFGITPGRYFVATGILPGQTGTGARGGLNPASSVEFRYFPGVSDLDRAADVDIKPGGESKADMNVIRQKLYTVRGRVVDSTGQMVSNAGLLPRQAPVRVSLLPKRTIQYDGSCSRRLQSLRVGWHYDLS